MAMGPKGMFTKKACISLMDRCGSINTLKQVHCQVLMSGLDQSRDIVDGFLVFLTDPHAGDMHYASKVFDSLLRPTLFAFNVMMKAFSKKGEHKKTALFYHRLREESIFPDNFTYPFVLKAFGCLRLKFEGMKTHGLVTKTGFEFDPYVRNSFIDMHAEMGNIETARSLFDEMPDRDVVSWNVLIAAHVKCKEFEGAISIFTGMSKVGVKPDEATLVSSLTACAAVGNLEVGNRIHRCMVEEFRFSLPLGNAILDMYVKCGDLDAANLFFKTMAVRNAISWTVMVSGYVNAGQLSEARKLFDCSPAKDVILWTAMINGYVQHNCSEEALDMFKEMQMKDIKPDKFTVVALLTLCANLGALEQGKWIHGYIVDRKIAIDNVVSTALIEMYAKCGCIEESLEIFNAVEGKDRITWTSTICGLALNGQTEKALELFSEMKMLGVEPDDITFLGVLSACNHGRLVDEGQRIFHEMKEVHHIDPKIEHYGCLADLLGRAGILDEAEQLIESVSNKEKEDILPLWGALLGACKIHGNFEMGKRLARKVAQQDAANSGLHPLAANLHAAAERWEDVTAVRKKMRSLGVKKIPGCSSIEVNGLVREFVVDDASHCETADMHRALDELSRSMESEMKPACLDISSDVAGLN
ncbi:hypothetical protein HPP92_006178 [Vanilla planifolia]|uniref:Pentatricopeptide repeat-containing protein n=1 Tax=Vanilla planifolia TaxID=51239 RepID=A0A835RQY7_VANPL|nr:hypothetical protein HPP92_006178 [Vanilla planifolia]